MAREAWNETNVIVANNHCNKYLSRQISIGLERSNFQSDVTIMQRDISKIKEMLREMQVQRGVTNTP